MRYPTHQPNAQDVREDLAETRSAAERGEEVLICRRNRPVARLVALPDRFFDPLPPALVGTLSGRAATAGTKPGFVI